MQPKLGQKIYCIFGDGIFKDTVGYLGKDSFIVSSFNSGTESDSWEWLFKAYDVQWFTNLAKAKKALIEQFAEDYEGKLKVTKMEDNWWQLEYC